MKKIIIIIVIGLLLLSVSLIITMRKNDRLAALDNFRQAVVGAEKIDDQGEVVVSVRPLAMSPDSGPRFNIVLDTHTIELDTDLMANAVLLVGAKEYQPLAWDGDLPGGHHRQGTLAFPPLTKIPDTVTLQIKNIGAVDARIFTWTLKTN